MHTNGIGDHPLVEAAAGRDDGGDGPPLSEAATATASSLPPPAPSASGAAVEPGATDGSPNDSPRSNATGRAGERPSDNVENDSRFLDYIAAPSDGHNTGPGGAAAPQFGVTLDGMDEEDPPVPPAQIGAEDAAINELIETPTNVEDMPMHPSKIVTDFVAVDKAMEVSQIVEQKETLQRAQDHLTPADFEKTDAASLQRTRERVRHQQEEILRQARGPPTPAKASLKRKRKRFRRQQERILRKVQDPLAPAVARAPSPPPMDQGRSPSNPRGQQQLPIRPPPQSMMPSPDDDTEPPVSALLRDPSIPRLRATLVEDQPDIPVYDAVQVAEQTRFEKNKKIIIGVGMGLLIGAVTAGVSVSSNNGSSGSNAIEPEGGVLSSPSDVPSLRPTLGPSRSLAPSTSLRPTTSLRPSQTPYIHPSSMPTATPPVYCGEIDILTDECFDAIRWNLVRFDTIGGTTYTEIILEGSPEYEGHHTYEACLERGDYEFAIFDSFGDGIDSPGYYSVAFYGMIIAHGGDFESEERVSFSLPLPSPPPSESSSPSELPYASFQPSASIVPSQSLRPSFRPSNSFSPSTYWSTLNWSRQGLGFNGDASNDRFALAVAFSEDASAMAIGAPGPWGNDNRPGYVKVYGRKGEGSSWEQRGDTIHGEANGDQFGHSLALSEDGTTLSIGAPRHDSDSGQVKVYQWDEAALDYVQIGDTLYGTAPGDEFGYSLDISNGKILVVGADQSDANGRNSGQVTVYAWDDASSNFKQRGVAINGNAAIDLFGYSVSFAEDGQKLAVGAIGNGSNGSTSGQVRAFEWDEATSNYEQLGDSLLGDAANDRFGWSMSFSRDGTTLAIGAPSKSENGQWGQWYGQVKVFAWDEAASNFEQIGRSLYGKEAGDRFGHSVALSSTGKTLAIGACQSIAGKSGCVEVYGWDEAASEYKRLGQSLDGKASGDQFGYALALAGNGRDLTVGAPYNDRNGTSAGRVEVFEIKL